MVGFTVDLLSKDGSEFTNSLHNFCVINEAFSMALSNNAYID